MRHLVVECQKILKEQVALRCGQQSLHEGNDALFIGLIRVDPAGMRLRFANRLEHVSLDALAQDRQLRCIQHRRRPHTQ